MSEAYKCLLYGLYSTRDGKIRYVGQTAGPLARRYAQHLRGMRHYRGSGMTATPVYDWIKGEWAAGHGVLPRVLKRAAVWNVDECRAIEFYRNKGHWLVNTVPGCMTALVAPDRGTTTKGDLGYRISIGIRIPRTIQG